MTILIVACVCATGVTASIGFQPSPLNSGIDGFKDANSESKKNIQTIGQTENEPNDDPQSANTLQSGTPVEGVIESSADVDWYQIPLTQNEVFQANLENLGGDGSLQVTYYYPNGSEITTQTLPVGSSFSNAQLQDVAILPGTYYIRVGSPDGTVQYQLSVSQENSGTINVSSSTDQYEPNNKISSATKLQPGGEIEASIGNSTDVDVYKTDVQEGGTVTFCMTNEGDHGSSLNIGFIDTQGNLRTLGEDEPFRSIPPGWWWSVTLPSVNETGTAYFVVMPGNGTGAYRVSSEVTNNSTTDGGIFGERFPPASNTLEESRSFGSKSYLIRNFWQ